MSKIIIGDKIFNEAPFPVTNEPSIFEKRRLLDGISRESIRITVAASYAEVAEYFVNGASWSIEETTTTENGALIVENYDKSEYNVAGDITDHRNGTITVYMSKPTEIEKVKETVQTVLPRLDDETALSVYTLFPDWTEETNYVPGDRLNYNGALYRVIEEHTSEAEKTPDVATYLYGFIGVTGQ